eukprot:SAG11_NODE_12505_length_699_cov_3.888333_1_plen_100_part_00
MTLSSVPYQYAQHRLVLVVRLWVCDHAEFNEFSTGYVVPRYHGTRVPGYNLLNLGPTGFATFHSEFAQWYHGTWVPRLVKFIKFRPYWFWYGFNLVCVP